MDTDGGIAALPAVGDLMGALMSTISRTPLEVWFIHVDTVLVRNYMARYNAMVSR